MDRPLVAVVLAGGTGTRLYPAARPDRPKQFLALDGERSLLARTVDRVGFADETLVVTRAAYADGVRERTPDATVLTEPAPKDTGPALVLAAHRAREAYDDPVLLCVPSDHLVADRDGPGGSFAGVGRAAARVAVETGGLVAVGVEPTRPATGYGYLEPGEWRDLPGGTTGEETGGDEPPADRADGDEPAHNGAGGEAPLRDRASRDAPPGDGPDAPGPPRQYAPLVSFHEKPDPATARDYVAAGRRWNAGVFAWTPAALLDAAADSPLGPMVSALAAGDPVAGFEAVGAASVDRAVMERADDAYVVPARFDWDDLGAWDALARALPPDADGNVVVGDAATLDASGNVVAGEDRHVSVVGADDLVVAAFDDRVLVVPKAQAQRVRDLVDVLRARGLY